MIDKWEQRYRGAGELLPPARVLMDNLHLLPEQGVALDLACGISGNGALLARRGLRVEVWDTSTEALALQNSMADSEGYPLTTRARDCEQSPPAPDSFDIITVCHFLFRPGCSDLVHALKPGGLLFYQTFTAGKLGDSGPSSANFLLQSNELLSLFSELEVRYYREDARCGDLGYGERDRALFVGQKL